MYFKGPFIVFLVTIRQTSLAFAYVSDIFVGSAGELTIARFKKGKMKNYFEDAGMLVI